MEDIVADVRKLRTKAIAHSSANESKRAEETFLQAIHKAKHHLGPHHRATVLAYADLGYFYSREPSNRLQSELYYRLALSEAERVYGYRQKPTLNILKGLIDVLWGYNNNESSVGLLRRLLEGRMKMLGTDHEDTIASMRNLAVAIHRGHRPEAGRLFRMQYDILQELKGRFHPSSLEAAVELAIFQYGRYAQMTTHPKNDR